MKDVPCNIAVLGAGVVGLAAAVRLLTDCPDVSVTVLADLTGSETTSQGSGGLWMPYTLGMFQWRRFPENSTCLAGTLVKVTDPDLHSHPQVILLATWYSAGPARLSGTCWTCSIPQPEILQVHSLFQAITCGRCASMLCQHYGQLCEAGHG